MLQAKISKYRGETLAKSISRDKDLDWLTIQGRIRFLARKLFGKYTIIKDGVYNSGNSPMITALLLKM